MIMQVGSRFLFLGYADNVGVDRSIFVPGEFGVVVGHDNDAVRCLLTDHNGRVTWEIPDLLFSEEFVLLRYAPLVPPERLPVPFGTRVGQPPAASAGDQEGRVRDPEPLNAPLSYHPGETLRVALGRWYEVDVEDLAAHVEEPIAVILRVLSAEHPVLPELALKLERVYGISANNLIRMQAEYDLAEARLDPEVIAKLDRLRPFDQPD